MSVADLLQTEEARVAFFVPGKPQTAGSKTAVPMGARMGVIEAGSKDSRARKRSWRGDLRDAASRAMDKNGGGWTGLASGSYPLSLTVVIVRKRPGSHLGTGRNAGTVKDWARPLLPTGRPDTVKVVRAAEDALTGWTWLDDSQIVEHRLYKAFADQVGMPPLMEGLYIAVTVASAYTGPRLIFELCNP